MAQTNKDMSRDMEKQKKEWRNAVYLTDVNDTMAALILESKLRAEGIPVEKRYRGAGNFLEIALGSNVTYPIELYVPAEALEDAKNIILPIPITDDYDVEGDQWIYADSQAEDDAD